MITRRVYAVTAYLPITQVSQYPQLDTLSLLC